MLSTQIKVLLHFTSLILGNFFKFLFSSIITLAVKFHLIEKPLQVLLININLVQNNPRKL